MTSAPIPTFSVVIPVKNRSRLLYRSLLSLREQSLQDFEVVVVDDGSTEDIGLVVELFNDLDITLLRLPEGAAGACAARNAGSDAARAPYIAYLDSDDLFLPDKLRSIAATVENTGADLLASPLLVYRGDERLQLRPTRAPDADEEISEFYFVRDQRIQSSSIVVSRDLFRAARWNENLRKVQDPDFFIRCCRLARKMTFLREPLAVLFDDEQGARISSAGAEHSIASWLDSPECPLTPKARSGFVLYALSHEVAKRSRIAALSMILRNARAVEPKTVLKSIYRTLAPEPLFKQTALIFATRGPRDNGTASYDYIERLKHMAVRAEGMS